MSTPRNVLIAGEWRPADSTGTFQARDPLAGDVLEGVFPVSSRRDIDAVLEAGKAAAEELAELPPERRAGFLESFAAILEERQGEIVSMASRETALPLSPRLRDVELPRTTNQLRLAAAAARDGSWTLPTIDTASNIRSLYGPLRAPVAVFGPNNFPFAFNSVSGGDFAAAIAAGNPVIAKANTSHPGTTQLLAEAAFAALEASDLPRATVQLIYRMSHEDGEYLVSSPLLGATGYTGSRASGLALKAAADRAGRPIYLELSSVNPVFILPGALRERADEIAGDFVTSALMGTGQFCTNPGIVVLLGGDDSERFIEDVKQRFDGAEPGPLLSQGVLEKLGDSVRSLETDGAQGITGGRAVDGDSFRFQNTLLRASAEAFLERPEALQREAFGNCSLFVVARDEAQLEEVAGNFEGNLTGCLYSHSAGDDDALYDRVTRLLRPLVGRLLNDKMPTGVAVSTAMNHGGPFPATGHPGFTAVGVPAALKRFSLLLCYDNVRPHRLPPELQDENPGRLWRLVDGEWTPHHASSAAKNSATRSS
ncbi:MAG: aldehyde dehydrogenase family protein [Planctomycetota bacterium]|nr:aldehyde dehydrogenase family protein [Planctomycetota bacterium]